MGRTGLKSKQRLTVNILKNLSFTLLTIISGCSSSNMLHVENADPKNIQSEIERYSEQFRNLDYFGIFHLKSPDLSLSLYGNSQFEHPSKFFGKINSPFGGTAGEVRVNSNSYELRLPTGEIKSGDVDSLDLEKLLGLPIQALDVVALFSPVAGLSLVNSELEFQNFTSLEESIWNFEYKMNDTSYFLQFDYLKGKIINESWVNHNTGTKLSKDYNVFINKKRLYLPTHIVIESLKEGKKSSITIEIESFSINPKRKKDPFRMRYGDSL